MSDAARTRRDFLRQSSACLTLAIGFVGFGGELSALPRSEAVGVPQGHERRYPVPASDGVTVDAQAQVLLVRYGGQILALSLSCPHQHAAVRWQPDAGRFQCSKHNSRYDPSGHYVSGRATRNLDRFPIRRDAGSVLVDVTRAWQADTSATEWAAAAIAVG